MSSGRLARTAPTARLDSLSVAWAAAPARQTATGAGG